MSFIKRLRSYILFSTVFKLGFISLLRMGLYKVRLLCRFDRFSPNAHMPMSSCYFYEITPTIIDKKKLVLKENRYFSFGWKGYEFDTRIWYKNLLTDNVLDCFDQEWRKIGDFESSIGDVKGVWELSRLDWAFHLVEKAIINDDPAALTMLNTKLHEWCNVNRAYLGPNWKCGQEASIRVIHLAVIAKILDQVNKTSQDLQDLICIHLERISPTILYAVSQDNNHGTTEAAALYIGGRWLELNGHSKGKKWKKQGRKWLEDRAEKLITEDGVFSQYSVNYHRLLLDTYSVVELWRLETGDHEFSGNLINKIKLACNWLYQLIDINTGDCPNLGNNDGARLIPLCDSDYRDFRPSIQLANVLFNNKKAFNDEGIYNQSIYWLNIKLPDLTLCKQSSFKFLESGYRGFRNERSFIFLNFPRFKYRPSQCDFLHLDFWLDGINIFRDGGTYSYNAGQSYIDYYGGTESHNTVQFDSREQMPRLRRFLLGGWLKAHIINDRDDLISVNYRDNFGANHTRTVKTLKSSFIVQDDVSGFVDKAILRWRLCPGEWQIKDKTLSNGKVKLLFTSDVEISRFELIDGYESRYYYNEKLLPVLEVEIIKPGYILTEVFY